MKKIEDFVQSLRENDFINEKKFGNISSFNFSRKAFWEGNWDNITTKARGLFINTHTNEIVARSYDKFFTIGERPETQKEKLFPSLKFPVSVYFKENGFLGILGYDSEQDKLLFCSKSTVEGDFAQIFKNILLKQVSVSTLEKIKEYLKQNNCTFVFEVIDPELDPHIIEYSKKTVCLLDVISNEIEFSNLSFDYMASVAEMFNLPRKSGASMDGEKFWFNNLSELERFYDFVHSEKAEDIPLEGFVFQDASGYMFKLKLPFYKKWKFMRSVAEEIRTKGFSKREAAFNTPELKEIYEFLKREVPKNPNEKVNIIKLRNQFYQK